MQKAKKASAASKKVVAAKTRQRASARQAPQMLAPGDEVRLPLRIHNRFAGYDPRLLRPTTMPFLARLAARFLRKPKLGPAPAAA